MEAVGIEWTIIIFLLAFVLACVLILALIWHDPKPIFRSKDEEEKKETPPPMNIEAVKILLEKGSVDTINDFIDSLIKEAANMYTILTAGKGVDRYITDREGEEMQKYIFGMVKRNMTKDVRDTIHLIYNFTNEKELDEVLTLRIKLYAANVIVQNNLPIE